jgi:metal-sulfur cluster biosynthetic enzyme
VTAALSELFLKAEAVCRRTVCKQLQRRVEKRPGGFTISVKKEMPTRGERVVTEERVQDQLRNVIDPEIGMDLVELGLIYDVGVHDEGRHVDVTFSLTSPMCPVGDLIQEQVETETLSIEGVETVTAQLTFEPMWSPEMMSPAAKLFFGR